MTGVLVLGDIPSTGIAGTSAERVVPGAPRTPGGGRPVTAAGPHDPLDSFVELIAQRIDQAKVVVAVYPAWQPDPARRYVQFARSALETEWVVGVASDLPPLALSVVADQLAYLAPYVPPGVLVGLAARLARDTLAGAWVASVARLEHVSTSLGHHVRSYLPGGFMVTAHPRGAVHRITGGAPVGDLTFRPAEPVQMLAARGDGDAEWFQKKLLPYLRPARVQFFQPQPFSATYWGTGKYVEYVAFSSHPQALTYAAGSVRVRRCRWCEQVVATPTCPFCGMTRQRSGQQAPQSPVQPAGDQPFVTQDGPGVPGSTPAPPAALNNVDPTAAALSAEPHRSPGPAHPPAARPADPLPSPTEPGSGVP